MIEAIIIAVLVVGAAVWMVWPAVQHENIRTEEFPYMKEGMRYAAEQDVMFRAGRSSTYYLPNFEYEGYRKRILDLRQSRLKIAKRKALRR